MTYTAAVFSGPLRLLVLLISEQSSAQCAVVLSQGRDVDLVSQRLLQRLDHAGVLGHAAGQHHLVPRCV